MLTFNLIEPPAPPQQTMSDDEDCQSTSKEIIQCGFNLGGGFLGAITACATGTACCVIVVGTASCCRPGQDICEPVKAGALLGGSVGGIIGGCVGSTLCLIPAIGIGFFKPKPLISIAKTINQECDSLMNGYK